MFYHLTRGPMEETLAMLLERARAAGWPVVVRGTDTGRMEALDRQLWLGSPGGFLPHGLEGGAHDADQPILLGTRTDAANGARCLMAIDGARVSPEEAGALERVCVLFDGNDPDALHAARAQWKELRDAGIPAQYWSEDSGRWEMKAET